MKKFVILENKNYNVKSADKIQRFSILELNEYKKMYESSPANPYVILLGPSLDFHEYAKLCDAINRKERNIITQIEGTNGKI